MNITTQVPTTFELIYTSADNKNTENSTESESDIYKVPIKNGIGQTWELIIVALGIIVTLLIILFFIYNQSQVRELPYNETLELNSQFEFPITQRNNSSPSSSSFSLAMSPMGSLEFETFYVNNELVSGYVDFKEIRAMMNTNRISYRRSI